jgi:hypothetical protein
MPQNAIVRRLEIPGAHSSHPHQPHHAPSPLSLACPWSWVQMTRFPPLYFQINCSVVSDKRVDVIGGNRIVEHTKAEPLLASKNHCHAGRHRIPSARSFCYIWPDGWLVGLIYHVHSDRTLDLLGFHCPHTRGYDGFLTPSFIYLVYGDFPTMIL